MIVPTLSGSMLHLACVFASIFSMVSAIPAPSPKCVTFETGFLATREITDNNGIGTGVHKHFAFNWRNELAFYHNTPHPKIPVQFQTCLPNYAHGDNFLMSKYGRIYLPDTKQCLAVKNPDRPTGPYYVERRGCLNSAAGEMATAASIPQNWLDQRGFLSWVGKSNSNFTVFQGGCKGGDFGYAMDKHGVPLSDKSGEYRVSLECGYNGPNTPLNSPFWTNSS